MSQNKFDINNRNAVITGGATGIGLALAKGLGAKGCKLIIAEPDEERLETAVNSLRELGIEAHHEVCDVTNLAQVEQLADRAWDVFGHVDMVFNNAGIGIRQKPIVDTSSKELHAVLDVNFFGVWYGSKVFAERLIEQGTPAGIYNTGSENSLFNAVPNNAAYLASKHAVLGMTENLREQMPDFVQVGLIIPGLVKSELTKRIAHLAMDADEFAECALQQIADGQFYIVSHSYNMVQIKKRYEEIEKAYAQYAPRYEGDEEYDIRHLMTNT
ncbi:MAG: SDR family NAD(P)-dependent oxidoreductase [Pseudomonadales bacterium]